MARMQPHHAEATVRPLVHHGMQPGDGRGVDIGQQQGVYTCLRAPHHRVFAIAVKRRLIKVGVGVDESHGAKLQRVD